KVEHESLCLKADSLPTELSFQLSISHFWHTAKCKVSRWPVDIHSNSLPFRQDSSFLFRIVADLYCTGLVYKQGTWKLCEENMESREDFETKQNQVNENFQEQIYF
ncbi:hypothetical protein STEG23_024761, partial [Scotinomys teguina]